MILLMTKREAKSKKAAWSLAVTEGRVVAVENAGFMTAFPTLEMRDAYIARLEAAGLAYRIASEGK
jgi:hypothetical protein